MEMQCDLYLPGHPIIYEDYRIHLARYVFASRYVKGADVLDIACGSGYGSSYLIGKGAKTVTGADFNEEAIEIARKNFSQAGLTFQAADALTLPFADSAFDVVTSMGMIDHLENPDIFLIGAGRVLRNRGYFICAIRNREAITPFPMKKTVSPFHKIEYSPLELSRLLSQYFSNVKVYGHNYTNKQQNQFRSMMLYFHQKLGIPYRHYDRATKYLTRIGNDKLKLFEYCQTLVYSERVHRLGFYR